MPRPSLEMKNECRISAKQQITRKEEGRDSCSYILLLSFVFYIKNECNRGSGMPYLPWNPRCMPDLWSSFDRQHGRFSCWLIENERLSTAGRCIDHKVLQNQGFVHLPKGQILICIHIIFWRSYPTLDLWLVCRAVTPWKWFPFLSSRAFFWQRFLWEGSEDRKESITEKLLRS